MERHVESEMDERRGAEHQNPALSERHPCQKHRQPNKNELSTANTRCHSSEKIHLAEHGPLGHALNENRVEYEEVERHVRYQRTQHGRRIDRLGVRAGEGGGADDQMGGRVHRKRPWVSAISAARPPGPAARAFKRTPDAWSRSERPFEQSFSQLVTAIEPTAAQWTSVPQSMQARSRFLREGQCRL